MAFEPGTHPIHCEGINASRYQTATPSPGFNVVLKIVVSNSLSGNRSTFERITAHFLREK
jgi:hypothetical protein